jgi:hypothetical protein
MDIETGKITRIAILEMLKTFGALLEFTS